MGRIVTSVYIALVALFLATEFRIAYAQETTQRSAEAPSTSVWAAKCTSNGRREKLDCSVEQTVILTKTRQFLLSVVVRVPPDTGQPAVMIHLPLGLFLPAGVTIQLDKQKPERLEVQTCDLKGCYVGSAVSDKMLQDMKRSERLTITFQDLSKNTINVRVPLKGFAAAYQRIQ